MAVDTPHVSNAADRWADDGGHAPVTTPTIIVRRAREGEHLTTLDGVDRALTPGANPGDLRTAAHPTGSREPADMLLIADTAGAIALAGIMGGAETEIDEHTTNVLLEAAAFNFINNRKTAAALKLPSEATARFGRGVPPAHTIPSATRAADLMRQLAQGELAPQIVDAYPGREPQPVIHFDTAEIRRLLGVDVPVERITSILKSLDFGRAADADGDSGCRTRTTRPAGTLGSAPRQSAGRWAVADDALASPAEVQAVRRGQRPRCSTKPNRARRGLGSRCPSTGWTWRSRRTSSRRSRA